MKKKAIFIGFALLLLTCLFTINASATYIGKSEGNDDFSNPEDVIDVINSNLDYSGLYDFDTYALEGFSKLKDFRNVKIGSVFQSDDGSFQMKVTQTKEGEPISGTWASTSPIDFIVIKASNDFAVYSVDQSTDGVWSTSDLAYQKVKVHKHGKWSKWITPGLSHISAYQGGTPPSGGGSQVPEPATIFLLGSGLLGFLGYRKKFWKPKN